MRIQGLLQFLPYALDSASMLELTPADRIALIHAIATREGTAKEIAEWYGTKVSTLRKFVEANREEIEQVAEQAQALQEETDSSVVTPDQLDELWITQKAARLARYQKIADLLFEEMVQGGRDSTTLREFRSYLTTAANELGQLLHRGSGDAGTDQLSVDIQGVDLEDLR